MPKDFFIPASGDIEYRHIVISTGFTQDEWVKAIEVRPGNRAVVHHIVACVRPPGDPNHRVDATVNVDQPAQLLRLIPHMHLRGKAFEVSHLQPGKDPRILLRVPRYIFNWQSAYQLDTPISLNPGDKIAVSGWFDSFPNNP